MSIWKLVKLNFGNNPAHFGELGIGIEESSERVRSDTLFSAWISSYARLFGKDPVENLLKTFPTENQPDNKPPFRISSTFIYLQNDKDTIYYVPRPLTFPINYPADDEKNKGDLEFFKTYKKLNYLPLEVWQKWYQSERFTKEDRQELIDYTSKKESHGFLNDKETFNYKKAFKIDQLPKIAVDRTTRATNLYHTGFVQFQSDQNKSGLYFLLYLSTKDQQLEAKLAAALHLLGEEGLGGERSSGAGRFEVEFLELPLNWEQTVNFSGGTHNTLISLFWDSYINQEFLESSSYEIQERGGWVIGSNVRRKMVRMFTEGSVFTQQPQGKLVDVTPGEFKKHSIYRSGISLSLPIKVQQQDK